MKRTKIKKYKKWKNVLEKRETKMGEKVSAQTELFHLSWTSTDSCVPCLGRYGLPVPCLLSCTRSLHCGVLKSDGDECDSKCFACAISIEWLSSNFLVKICFECPWCRLSAWWSVRVRGSRQRACCDDQIPRLNARSVEKKVNNCHFFTCSVQVFSAVVRGKGTKMSDIFPCLHTDFDATLRRR